MNESQEKENIKNMDVEDMDVKTFGTKGMNLIEKVEKLNLNDDLNFIILMDKFKEIMELIEKYDLKKIVYTAIEQINIENEQEK